MLLRRAQLAIFEMSEDLPDGSKNANLSYNHADLDVWTDREQNSS
jgi:hypothetical protein